MMMGAIGFEARALTPALSPLGGEREKRLAVGRFRGAWKH